MFCGAGARRPPTPRSRASNSTSLLSEAFRPPPPPLCPHPLSEAPKNAAQLLSALALIYVITCMFFVERSVDISSNRGELVACPCALATPLACPDTADARADRARLRSNRVRPAGATHPGLFLRERAPPHRDARAQTIFLASHVGFSGFLPAGPTPARAGLLISDAPRASGLVIAHPNPRRRQIARSRSPERVIPEREQPRAHSLAARRARTHPARHPAARLYWPLPHSASSPPASAWPLSPL